jgi:hypothetical protein
MTRVADVPKEKLERALQDIRRDTAALHRDLAYAAGDRVRWLFLLIWIALSDFMQNAFHLHALYALGAGALLVLAYRLVDNILIRKRAMRMLNEPVEPMWETKIEL